MSNGNGGATPASTAFTKTELLASLRAVESRLYSPAVEAKVKPLSADQRQQFVAERLHLTAVITQLTASLMKDIREDLDRQSPALRQGIDGLAGSLNDLDDAAQWAGAVSSVIGLIGKVISFL
jgi:hypothetical protein